MMSTIFVLLICVWLHLLAFWNDTLVVASPTDCLNNRTVEELVDCLNDFTVDQDFYDSDSYAAAQPSPTQVDAWTSTVASLLDVDDTSCSIPLPSSLSSIYAISPFLDMTSNTSFCILSETTSLPNHTYTKGWGLMIVPALQKSISRNVHLSAPHPLADIGTPQQAAAMFALSGAHSLLVSGRMRTAFNASTDCVIPANRNTTYFKTDPAHDVNEPFNIANRAIRAWQKANGGCPSSTCAYVQIHGKAASTCPEDTAFISSGIGSSASGVQWYQSQVNLPARRVQASVRAIFSNFTASLPSDDTNCSLTATENVFGRLINGVPEENVCSVGANETMATGQFIHIEQAIISRQSDAYSGWGEVIRRTFETSCRNASEEDKETGLCA